MVGGGATAAKLSCFRNIPWSWAGIVALLSIINVFFFHLSGTNEMSNKKGITLCWKMTYLFIWTPEGLRLNELDTSWHVSARLSDLGCTPHLYLFVCYFQCRTWWKWVNGCCHKVLFYFLFIYFLGRVTSGPLQHVALWAAACITHKLRAGPELESKLVFPSVCVTVAAH